jgi:hypothetical protein
MKAEFTIIALLTSSAFAQNGQCYKATKEAQALAEKQAREARIPEVFRGQKTGLMSWFRANHGSDNTNGNSWCGYQYKDYTPGFAPPLLLMTEGSGAVYGNPMWSTYGGKYCGAEAIVCNGGNCQTLFIVDAFEPAWVRTEFAIDVMAQSFQSLTEGAGLDKNNVKTVTWTLTGNYNDKYRFGGQGDR